MSGGADPEPEPETQPDERPIGGIVVGIDGSTSSLLAVDWAAAAAAAHQVQLTLLTAHPDAQGEVTQVEADSEEAVQLIGRKDATMLQVAVDRALAADPDLTVATIVHPESPVNALLDASRTAVAIVVGSRGLEGFRGLVLGSTSMNLAPQARCPVVVLYETDEETVAAQENARHPAEVVVGYDGSVSADLALDFGLRHASATGLGVAVVVVSKHRGDPTVHPVTSDWEELGDDVRDLVRSASQVAEIHPDVEVSYLHGVGRPAEVLIHEASGSPLAVVGARGRGGLAGLLLGSVGLQMLIHAECPVAVVHATGRSD